MTQLHGQNLSFSYPHADHPALSPLSITLNPSELILIIGKNGSGKTTLLKLLAGLLTPKTGEITLNNQTLTTLSPQEKAKNIGHTDTQLQAAFRFTTQDIIQMGRYPHQFKDPENKVQESLEKFDLQTLKTHFIDTLSAGELQRCNLAKIWAQTTPIWLLDEPLEHIDIAHRQKFLTTLKTHLKNNGSAIIISHHWEEFLPLCTQIIGLKNGQATAIDPIQKEVLAAKVLELFELKK